MTRFGIFLTVLLCLSLLTCSKSVTKPAGEPAGSAPNIEEPKKIASIDVVRAAASPTDIAAGGSGQVDVHLLIQPGYHINANPPTYSYLKATELEVVPSEGISVGPISYPKPLDRKFPFAEKPLAVYEGETELKAILKADGSVAKGERSVSARLRIQACDDQVCYPPGTLNLTIPVTIK